MPQWQRRELQVRLRATLRSIGAAIRKLEARQVRTHLDGTAPGDARRSCCPIMLCSGCGERGGAAAAARTNGAAGGRRGDGLAISE